MKLRIRSCEMALGYSSLGVGHGSALGFAYAYDTPFCFLGCVRWFGVERISQIGCYLF